LSEISDSRIRSIIVEVVQRLIGWGKESARAFLDARHAICWSPGRRRIDEEFPAEQTQASLPSEAPRTFAERQLWLGQRREGAPVRLCALVPWSMGTPSGPEAGTQPKHGKIADSGEHGKPKNCGPGQVHRTSWEQLGFQ